MNPVPTPKLRQLFHSATPNRVKGKKPSARIEPPAEWCLEADSKPGYIVPMKFWTVWVLGLMSHAGAFASPVAVDSGTLVFLQLRNGSEVSGRILDATEDHIHLVRAGFNRKIALRDLDDDSRTRLGLMRDDTAPAPARSEVSGLDATRAKLQTTLERAPDRFPAFAAPVVRRVHFLPVLAAPFPPPLNFGHGLGVYCPPPRSGIEIRIGF